MFQEINVGTKPRIFWTDVNAIPARADDLRSGSKLSKLAALGATNNFFMHGLVDRFR